MKIIISITFVLLTLVNICYSQSGWFTQNSNTTNHLRDVHFINQQTGWAVGWSNTIRKTTNGGISWFSQSTPFSQNSYQGCYFVNENTGWIGGGSQTGRVGYIYKTTDGGGNWTNQYYLSSSGMIMRFLFRDSLNGWAIGLEGIILKTSNGGQTWNTQVSGVNTDIVGIYFHNANLGWVVGWGGVILRTTTGGAVWSPYYSGTTINLEGVAFMSQLTGFVVGYGGIILKSTDGGQNWIQKPSPTSNWINSISFVSNDTAWISGGNYNGAGEMFKTTNRGDNWIPQTIPSVSWIADMQFVTPDKAWAVGSNGIIISTQNGGLPLPNPPNLIFPPNNSINLPVNTTFRWSNVTGVRRYTFQVSPLSNFSVIADSVTVDTNFYFIPPGKLTFALTYFWRVRSVNSSGAGPWSTVWMFSTLTKINNISSAVPSEFKVYDAYPNPFNPVAKIKFDIPKATYIKMNVYDVTGRQVEKLFEGNISAGTFESVWNAEKFNSGVYIIRFVSNEYSASKKVLLIK